MARKRFTPEQIIVMLKEAEVMLSQGEKVKMMCLTVSQIFYKI